MPAQQRTTRPAFIEVPLTPTEQQAAFQEVPRPWWSSLKKFEQDLGIGVVKGAGQTAVNLGRLVQLVPGVAEAIDRFYGIPGLSERAMREADIELTATSTAQKVGKFGEQIAEIVAPSRMITAAGTALATRLAPRLAPVVGNVAARLIPRAVVEGAGSAGIAAAQGGSPTIAGTMGAALPIAGAMTQRLAPILTRAAERQVVQALGPTKERFKAMAQKAAPGVLKRGLRGGRETMLANAKEMADEVGQKIDDALTRYAKDPHSTKPIIDALETAKEPFLGRTAGGLPVVLDARAVKQVQRLQNLVETYGKDISTESLVKVRRAWDLVVDQVGGFAHRAPGGLGIPLREQTEAWAKREGAMAIRKILASDTPDLAALNKEYSFWAGLRDVLTQTIKRTQPQGPGVGRMAAEVGGQVVGGMVGSAAGTAGTIGGAIALGRLANMATTIFRSPSWRMASAQAKNQLAEAIMSGNTSAIATALGRISAVEGAKIGR